MTYNNTLLIVMIQTRYFTYDDFVNYAVYVIHCGGDGCENRKAIWTQLVHDSHGSGHCSGVDVYIAPPDSWPTGCGHGALRVLEPSIRYFIPLLASSLDLSHG